MTWPSLGPSTRDIRASVGRKLAEIGLAVPYAIYWYTADMLQTGPSTVWSQYRTQQDTHLTNPTLQTALAAAKGVLSILEPLSKPGWVVRATENGRVPPLGFIPVPSIVVDVVPVETGGALELGTNHHWQVRRVDLAGTFRTPWEQEAFADLLSASFRKGTHLDIRDWSATGAQLLAQPRIEAVWCDALDFHGDEDVLLHQVGLTMDLEFTA